MTDKQIIDEERMFECVWCKYGFKESDANFILSENPNECVCSGCITEWADNLLCDLKRKEQECEELKDYARRQENQRETYYKEFLKKDKALEEIEEVCKNGVYDEFNMPLDECDFILNIINKTKGEGNE